MSRLRKHFLPAGQKQICVVVAGHLIFVYTTKDAIPFLRSGSMLKVWLCSPNDRFTEIGPEDAGRVCSRFAGKWNGRDFGSERSIEDALDAYKLALYCSQLRKDVTADIFTSICMRMAWLYRIKGDTEEERRFLAHALEQYMVLYDRGDTPEKMDEITLIYLMGELNRRLGNADDAVIWFSRVVSHSMAGQKPLIVRMAREQWSMVRNTIKESGQDG